MGGLVSHVSSGKSSDLTLGDRAFVYTAEASMKHDDSPRSSVGEIGNLPCTQTACRRRRSVLPPPFIGTNTPSSSYAG